MDPKSALLSDGYAGTCPDGIKETLSSGCPAGFSGGHFSGIAGGIGTAGTERGFADFPVVPVAWKVV